MNDEPSESTAPNSNIRKKMYQPLIVMYHNISKQLLQENLLSLLHQSKKKDCKKKKRHLKLGKRM